MTGCCTARRDAGWRALQLDVHSCFERGLATRRLPPLEIRGERLDGQSGLWAAFSLAHDTGELRDIRFAAPGCTTLIAYCEALKELGHGSSLGEAQALDTAALISCLPGVPEMKQDRALLAVAAFRAALLCADQSPT